MIIDAHTHVHPDQDGMGQACDARIEFLIEQLEECDVDKAVVLPIAADSAYAKRTDNAFVAECCRRYPDQLIGFASVHPFEHRDPADRLARDVAEYGLRGLKLHPRFQGFRADDARLAPLVERAAELGLPIAIDALLWKPTPVVDQLPLNIDALCKRVPQAKVIVCHAGGFRFMDALALAVANDGVFLDVSISLEYFFETPFEDQFMFVLKQVGAKRVIYGSDHPQHPLKRSYEQSKTIFAKYGFADEELALIFGGNIHSLLFPAQRQE